MLWLFAVLSAATVCTAMGMHFIGRRNPVHTVIWIGALTLFTLATELVAYSYTTDAALFTTYHLLQMEQLIAAALVFGFSVIATGVAAALGLSLLFVAGPSVAVFLVGLAVGKVLFRN